MSDASRHEDRWVLVPVGQQAGGAWIDDVLRERLRDSPVKRSGASAGEFPRQRIEVLRGRDADAEVNERFYRRGWTDGLPIVAPTLFRVQQMLRYSPIGAQDVIGEVEPLRGVATAEKVAANAVMAGCRSDYFPVVLAATRALLDPSFNLRGVQTTDENVTPLVIVGGPIVDQLDINGGFGALGPGWRANATIGRAIRLVMNNLGGGRPGLVSLAGIGQPARYTLCIAESERSPWPPLHVESGLGVTDSAVTMLRAESSINVTGGLDELASVMGSAASAFSVLHGGRVAVLLAPPTAQELAARGWSKDDVRRYLFEHGRIPSDTWQRLWVRARIASTYGVPDWVKRSEDRDSIPIVATQDDIVVVVAGGSTPIAQHVYFPGWGFPPCRVVSRVDLPGDWADLGADDREGGG